MFMNWNMLKKLWIIFMNSKKFMIRTNIPDLRKFSRIWKDVCKNKEYINLKERKKKIEKWKGKINRKNENDKLTGKTKMKRNQIIKLKTPISL